MKKRSISQIVYIKLLSIEWQKMTTNNLQPRLSKLLKKQLSKTLAPSSGKFQQLHPMFGNHARIHQQ